MKYYYETHSYHADFEAKDDTEALKKLEDKFGKALSGVMILYVEENQPARFRTIWVEV